MVDTHFYSFAGPVLLSELLQQVGMHSPPAQAAAMTVTGAAEIETAQSGDLVLAANKKYAAALADSKASTCITSPAIKDLLPSHMLAVISDDPHALFADILEHLYGNTRMLASWAESENVFAPACEENVRIGANVVCGPDVQIGRDTVIGANTVIGPGVTIGRNAVIGSNVSIEFTHLGDAVVIHAGARIGTEGFGWLDHGRTNRKIPQLGRVIIQDRVEIGANSTIDRGALGDTVIGEGTKIDNLVQIGHNCRIGRNCLIAGMAGLSGSTVLGDGVLMGGGAGTSGHLTIGDGSVVHGRAAVTKDWPQGSRLAGTPAQDIKDFWRDLALLRRLGKGE